MKRWKTIALILLVLLWIASIFLFFQLPDSIPVHFNGKSEPDGWGHKAFVFLGAGLCSLLYVFFQAISHRPGSFNYPGPRSEVRDRRAGRGLFIVLSSVIAVFFIVLWLTWFKTMPHPMIGGVDWVIPVVLGMIITASLFVVADVLRK